MNKKILCFLICFMTIFTTFSYAKPLAVKDIAKKNNCLVLLTTYDVYNNPVSTGSGFIVSKDGKLVTNYHVIDKASKVTATLYTI